MTRHAVVAGCLLIGLAGYALAISTADTTLANVPHEFFLLPTIVRGAGGIPSGVRYTIETIGGREVFEPDRWRTSDVAAIGVLLAGRFGSGRGRQLRQAALLNYLTGYFARTGAPPRKAAADAARDVFEDVRWIRDPNSPTTIPANLLAGTGPLPRLSYGLCNGTTAQTPGFGNPDPRSWGWRPPPSLDFDCLDNFANNFLSFGTKPTSFGRAPEENRSTYMQALEVGRRQIVGANVIAPGQSGFIHHLPDGTGLADPHMGDQAVLFRMYEYKPMQLR